MLAVLPCNGYHSYHYYIYWNYIYWNVWQVYKQTLAWDSGQYVLCSVSMCCLQYTFCLMFECVQSLQICGAFSIFDCLEYACALPIITTQYTYDMSELLAISSNFCIVYSVLCIVYCVYYNNIHNFHFIASTRSTRHWKDKFGSQIYSHTPSKFQQKLEVMRLYQKQRAIFARSYQYHAGAGMVLISPAWC